MMPALFLLSEDLFVVERIVFAEELLVLDGDSPLWQSARPLLDIALRLEQNEDNYSWHGWNKEQINAFLNRLPSRCSLVVGVWETIPGETGTDEYEELVLGVVCEVVEGEVHSIRTFQALTSVGRKPTKQLEPGIDDAWEIMHTARKLVAPVAWALFMEKSAWDEWLFAAGDGGTVIDKGELLATLNHQGRCVLLGDQSRIHTFESR
jgi:hypothetical protein